MLQLQKRRALSKGLFTLEKPLGNWVLQHPLTLHYNILGVIKKMKKEKWRSFMYGIMCVLLIILIMCIILGFNTCPKKYKYETYVVYPGDTLWSIAASTNPEEDIREIIYMIRQKNDISPTIYPGQELLIPVLEK